MSSDEDFSLVVDPLQSEETLEGVRTLISNYKKRHEQLLEEQKELAISRDDLRELTNQFRQRRDKLKQSLKESEVSHNDRTAKEEAKLNLMKQEESELMKEIQKNQAALKEEEGQIKYLKQQAHVFTAVPERELVFKGLTGSADNMETFEMQSRIVYPMEGGMALVTFEEEAVAKKVLDRSHRVGLGGECSISVEARPVHLMLPSLVEIDSEVCPQRILISNLPKMDTEILRDKLEIHFSKCKNGGGEVVDCELLSDSGTVVITFVRTDIAKGLTATEYHEVKLQQARHRVRVTPFLNGKIANFKTKMTPCRRTVLLTGIPAVMERETLQDLLEIHFQKNSNGGGEIEAFIYNPAGQRTFALFEDVSPATEK